jgi:exopolysaccharide biosynthesis polyprenyl glycosylphosphotransferase
MTITLTAALVASGIARVIVHQTIQRRRTCGEYTYRVVLFGNERETHDLAEKMRESAGFAVVGICDMVDRPGALPESDINRLTSMVRDREASMVMVGGAGHDLRRLSWALEPTGAEVMFTPPLRDVDTARLKVAAGGDVVAMALGQPKFTGASRLLKTMIDRAAAAAAIAVLAPLFAVIALAIKVDSSGPIIFKQVRVGEHGRPFQIYKFRSMTADAEARKKELDDLDEGSGALFKVRADPRITRVGGLLRRTSLDELPQLLNVLLGQMSLVGPRPHLQEEMLSSSDPTWTRRLLVKPGVTGLWQVSGRSDLSHEDTVRLDLSYVENWSLPWDLAIMLRTPLSMARRQGAY